MKQHQNAIYEIIQKSHESIDPYFTFFYYWVDHIEVSSSTIVIALLNPHNKWYCNKGQYRSLFLNTFTKEVLGFYP